ncbi:MAG: GNAT family N-acetyltransferase [Chromatiales bacterium]|jgi:GNAT superfamily N-acetyltransferase
MNISIRQYRPEDAQALTEIFYSAVESLAGDCYSREQVRAWAPLPIDYEKWRFRLERQQTWVAEVHGTPIGFISLIPDGHISLAYVHIAFQRKGVASKLYTRLEREARAAGVDILRVEASHAARPLFQRMGFDLLKRNRIERNACTLVNWSMQKSI